MVLFDPQSVGFCGPKSARSKAMSLPKEERQASLVVNASTYECCAKSDPEDNDYCLQRAPWWKIGGKRRIAMAMGQKFLEVMTRTVYQVVTIDDTRIILETRDGIH
jgi:hypothetical protein